MYYIFLSFRILTAVVVFGHLFVFKSANITHRYVTQTVSCQSLDRFQDQDFARFPHLRSSISGPPLQNHLPSTPLFRLPSTDPTCASVLYYRAPDFRPLCFISRPEVGVRTSELDNIKGREKARFSPCVLFFLMLCSHSNVKYFMMLPVVQCRRKGTLATDPVIYCLFVERV